VVSFRRWARNVLIAAAALLVLGCVALLFGMSRDDIDSLRRFEAAVVRWQKNPDFRLVAHEYVTLGTRAMQAHFWGIPAKTVVLKFRSLPGLPASLAVSSTSASHYEDFSRGELSAYLHLCDEQGVEDFLPTIEQFLASRVEPTDEQLAGFLRSFRMPVPIASDAGAVRSVRAMLRDIEATPPTFVVRTRIGGPLVASLGLRGRVEEMTPLKQRLFMAGLDQDLRAADRQLWRTKQVSDLLAGIWAQGYGQIYSSGIGWLFRLRAIARLVLGVAFVAIVAVVVVRRFPKRRAVSCPTA
jgi:hypothetical protein